MTLNIWMVLLISAVLGAIASYVVTVLYGVLSALRGIRVGR